LKKIFFLFNLFSFSIFASEYNNYPFDWTNHFGVISQNGRVIWNDDWIYGILFFDGTFGNYPLRYGLNINENYSLFNTGYFPKQDVELDTNFVDTRLQYTQGDYYLDMLSIRTRYVDKSRLLSINGYKKTFTGPYGEYSLGMVQPIQQSYFIEYKTNQFQAAIGHFVTSNGVPDSSSNGSLYDRILNASILTKGIIGDWKWTLYGSQYNQKYKVLHSSWYNASIQYLTRSMIQGNIINEIKDSILISFGFRGNIRGLSDIESFSSKKWGSMYSMLSIKNLNIEGGIFSINKDSNTFLRILFYLERQNKGISIEANRKTKPSHQFTSENNIYSQFENTKSIEFRSWYDLSRFKIKTKLYSEYIFQSSNHKVEILGGDINIVFSLSDDWIFSSNLRHLVNPSIVTDGVGDFLEFNLSAKENLFNNNMLLFIDLGLTGWINRESDISFNPIYCMPISITDTDYILEDQWILKSGISLKVSSLKVTWKMNNILNAIQPTINSINEKQTLIVNNYLMHQNNRNLGRLMEIHIDWYFSD
tara:strand:+ start:2013 stop:3611 length:1599 start_codon:yes stop_codon:yes gene_type:complete